MTFYQVPLLERSTAKTALKSRKIDLKECSALAHNGVLQVKEYDKSESPIIATAKISVDEKKDRVLLFEEASEQMVEAMEMGEITHAYLQAILSESDFDLASFNLSDEKMKEIERYKERFLSSTYGKMALEASVKKMEYGFITKNKEDNKEEIIRGVIDLFFEVGDTVYIIDYKTDARKSDNYNRQLSVYKKAISDLYKSMHSDKTFKIKAYLFYLRTGEAVEVLG